MKIDDKPLPIVPMGSVIVRDGAMQDIVLEAMRRADLCRLVDALVFYADPKSWAVRGHPQIADLVNAHLDRGERARIALKHLLSEDAIRF